VWVVVVITRGQLNRQIDSLWPQCPSSMSNIEEILKRVGKKKTLRITRVLYTYVPSSGILETRKHDVSETGSVSFLTCGGKHVLS
jgi:hypothetical protein